MNDARQPGPPYPPPNHSGAHPQAPQIHPAPPLRPTITPVAPHAPAPPAPAHAPPPRPGIAPMPTGLRAPSEDELEPIELVDEEPELAAPVAPSGPTQLRSQQQGSVQQQPQQHSAAPKKIVALGADAHRAHHDWKRVPVKTGTGACRVRSFHGKYSEQGLEYLDNAINEWLDGHPEVEVKFVTSTVMTFEGKIREPALVLNVWY
jgi:hypothetical protein